MSGDDRCVKELVSAVLEDKSPLDTKELVNELYERDLAYAMIDGTKCRISKVALDKILSEDFIFRKSACGGWKKSVR